MSACILRRIVPAVVVAAAVATLAIACSGGNSTTTSAPSPTVTPIPTATTVTLSGQVADSTTATPISGATMSIADGSNAGKSATADSSGNYSFTGLQPSGFTVNASAPNYVAQSKGVTLTSNQTLSFQLTRQTSQPAPTPSPSCSYTLSVGSTIDGYPNGVSFPIPVTTTAGCPWTALSNVSWIHVTPSAGTGTGTFTISVDANTGSARTGTVTVAGNAVTVNQTATATSPSPGPLPLPPPSSTYNGQAVPAIVDCLNNQGVRPPTAKCNDGTYSCSQNRSGTCSSHSGVSCYVCPGPLC
jgi:hypothetical protein